MKILIKKKIISSFTKNKRKYKYKRKNDNKYYKMKFLFLCIMSCSLSLIFRTNELKTYIFYKSLKNVSYENITLLNEYRNILLKIFSRNSHKNLTEIDNIYMDYFGRFGNKLVVFNKVFFYCEIIKCKKIILEKDNNIYIRNKINDRQFNLTIEMAKPGINYIKDSIFNYYPNPFSEFLEIKPENRFSVFRDEMLRNLPNVHINKDDIYIHIRGGDIFIYPHGPYGQPPYCFYKTIINTNLFDKIHIIAEDTNNPVLNKLLETFPNIIFKKNNIEHDIAYLARAYNLVASVSSFSTEESSAKDASSFMHLSQIEATALSAVRLSYPIPAKAVTIAS